MHGSHTSVGARFDVDFIAIVAYTAHQASVSAFASDSTILNDLSVTARSKTGAESQEDIIQMSLNKPVEEWTEVFLDLDVPNEGYSFAALLCTLLVLLLPED